MVKPGGQSHPHNWSICLMLTLNEMPDPVKTRLLESETEEEQTNQ